MELGQGGLDMEMETEDEKEREANNAKNDAEERMGG